MTEGRHGGDAVRRLTSTVTDDGTLELAVSDGPAPEPREHEVVVQIDAAPVNPSDLIVMLADVDPAVLRRDGETTLRAPMEPGWRQRHAERLGVPVPVGNEGAGRVVRSGSAPEARALLGRRVAVLGGGTFAEAVCVPWRSCLLVPDTTPIAAAAGAFVNPLTVIGMLATMRDEGRTSLVHTAAASSLGRMLVRRCVREGVPLVNVVRRPEQAEILLDLGATHVCVSDMADFDEQLVEAIAATGASLAFDAVGGAMTGDLLRAMELAHRRTRRVNGPYGTDVHKQVYVYGFLDPADVRVRRDVGMAWGVGGWLLADQLRRVGPDGVARWREQVIAGLDDEFSTSYGPEVTLDGLVDPGVLQEAHRCATGQKYLVVPRRA